ncbi:hypothetical protein BKI52_38515 [marine bacterium AO1-C]|nr:hypothetical protein BKI52_38515 [marine bacterium AO1-C]
MIYQHQTSNTQILRPYISFMIVFVCFFIASCNQKVFSQAQKNTTKAYPSLPKGFKILKEINLTGQTQTQTMKLEKGITYTVRFVKNKDNRTKVQVYDGEKKIVSSFVRGRYYSGISYKCGKTGNYTFVIESDPSQEPPKVVMAYKKS